MPFTMNLSTNYHRQDEITYCGAACAQMILSQIGAGILSQHSLFTDNNKHGSERKLWYSNPKGLTWTMNNRKPAAFRGVFELIATDNEDNISRNIIWSLYNDKVAAIAAVYRGQHWIVIKGFDSTVAPAGSDDQLYSIKGFWINDPSSLGYPHHNPPPHTNGDTCGSGTDYGIANQHVNYNDWQNTYMLGIEQGQWRNKFLAVCDPGTPSEDKNKKTPGEKSSENNTNDLFHPGEVNITKEEAQEAASWALYDQGLVAQEFLKDILENIKPGMPMLVKRLDKTNDFYYLVPMLREEKNTVSLVSIDAFSAAYKQSAFAKNEKGSIGITPLSEEEILKLLGNKIEIKKEKIVLDIDPKSIIISPFLGWMPCAESFSPYFPFYIVNVDNHTIFVRVDGQVFTELTTDILGA